jgi:hypothetical protein
MTKAEFAVLVDEMIEKVQSVPFDNHTAGVEMIAEVENFIGTHGSNLSDFAYQGTEFGKYHFDEMRDAKTMKEKQKNWSDGIVELVKVLSALKTENSFLP